jgi:hypothetical protein
VRVWLGAGGGAELTRPCGENAGVARIEKGSRDPAADVGVQDPTCVRALWMREDGRHYVAARAIEASHVRGAHGRALVRLDPVSGNPHRPQLTLSAAVIGRLGSRVPSGGFGSILGQFAVLGVPRHRGGSGCSLRCRDVARGGVTAGTGG